MTNRSTSSPSSQKYPFVSGMTAQLLGHLASDVLEQHFVLLFPQQSSADTAFNINVISEHENSRHKSIHNTGLLLFCYICTYIHFCYLLLDSCSMQNQELGRYNYMCSCMSIMAHLGFSGFKSYYLDYRLVIKSYLPAQQQVQYMNVPKQFRVLNSINRVIRHLGCRLSLKANT